MIIRPATVSDLDEILELFYNTITNICKADYGDEQIKVWTSSANNKQKWINRINTQYFLVAEISNKMVGFGSIDNGNFIDLLYVHKDCQKQGIAYQLLHELEKESDKQGKKLISSDVSITAKPFFEKQGYRAVNQQKNMIDGVEIVNYKMIKE